MLLTLSPLYDWLVLFGFIATVIACAVALYRLDTRILSLTSLPLGFILLNAILLMSQDRMVLPTYPLLLTNLLLFPTLVRRRDDRWLPVR
jgi:hypothetical protein